MRILLGTSETWKSLDCVGYGWGYGNNAHTGWGHGLGRIGLLSGKGFGQEVL